MDVSQCKAQLTRLVRETATQQSPALQWENVLRHRHVFSSPAITNTQCFYWLNGAFSYYSITFSISQLLHILG